MATSCVACQQPLTLEIEHDSSDDEDVQAAQSSTAAQRVGTETVPDDVALNCGCHFHWCARQCHQYHVAQILQPVSWRVDGSSLISFVRQCLIDAYTITQCPNCSSDLVSLSPTGSQQILCDFHNEAGLQQNLDILPFLTEEAYLKAYPEDAICRSFLELCREGDHQAVAGLLKAQAEGSDEMDEDDEGMEQPKKTVDEILRYQDPIGDMQSGLHAAVQAESREVAWLLLLLASDLDISRFPALVFQEAGALGVMRDEKGLAGKLDIRTLRDVYGRTAEQLAVEVGGVWNGWPGTGRLAV